MKSLWDWVSPAMRSLVLLFSALQGDRMELGWGGGGKIQRGTEQLSPDVSQPADVFLPFRAPLSSPPITVSAPGTSSWHLLA